MVMLVDYMYDIIVYDMYRNMVRDRTRKEGYIIHWHPIIRSFCKHSDIVVRDVVRLYLSGLRIDEIEEITGVNRGCIYYYLREYGYKPLRRGPRRLRRVSEEEKKLIIKMYKSGKSIYSIAKELKRSSETVWRILVEAGVHKPGR